jgi:hypothetical protein
MLLKTGHYLTIRRALWIVKLLPLLKEKDAKGIDLTKLYIIASIYSRREQLSEIDKKPYADTSDLDKIFILNKDVLQSQTILKVWNNEYSPSRNDEVKVPDENKPEDTIEAITGKIDALQKKRCNEFLNLLTESLYFKRPVKDAMNFIQYDHPEIEPFALKIVAFILRKDLSERYETIKKNYK